jgi:hypothetical protein
VQRQRFQQERFVKSVKLQEGETKDEANSAASAKELPLLDQELISSVLKDDITAVEAH